MEVIYYCGECDSAFGGEENTENYCPKCSANNKKISLIETEVRRGSWRLMDEDTKEEHKKEFRESYAKHLQREKEHEERVKQIEEERKRIRIQKECEEAQLRYETELREKEQSAPINDTYEYEVLEVVDNNDGSSNANRIKAEINRMARLNWRLVSVTTNEIGKQSSSLGFGGISSGSNATIDSTILIFERRIRKAE